MTHSTQAKVPDNSFEFFDYSPKPQDLAEAIAIGWNKTQKSISPKFFYDQQGSRIFDEICQLPEYYVTRTEIALLERFSKDIAQCIGPDSSLIELGSGSSKKIRIILEALRPNFYLPIDISKEHLLESVNTLSRDYSWLNSQAICLDYSTPWQLPESVSSHNRVAFFPGSSIGNFEPEQAKVLLRQIADALGADGKLIIGVDLKKSSKDLNAAYNDSQGVTARFNKNLLHRIQKELKTDIDPETFQHQAFYNAEMGRIEMHLVSTLKQTIMIEDHNYHFDKGETIHTESSYKYSASEFQELAAKCGLKSRKCWVDRDALFSIHYFDC